MNVLSGLRRNVAMVRRIVWTYSTLNPAMETVYRDLFVRDMQAVGIEDIFYPVGGAANHGLLYLLLRTLREFEIHSVLELGAGQSSLLLNAARRKLRPAMDVTTVEHDADWADHIRRQVSHRIIEAPLTRTTVEGHAIDYYSAGFIPTGKKFDLVVVDGPPAYDPQRRYARLGCLSLIPDVLARDFILVVDDAEREGEAHLVSRLAAAFASRNIAVRQATLTAKKLQVWFCGGTYSRAAFF